MRPSITIMTVAIMEKPGRPNPAKSKDCARASRSSKGTLPEDERNGTHPPDHLLHDCLVRLHQEEMAPVEYHQPGHRRHDSHHLPGDHHLLHEHRGAFLL